MSQKKYSETLETFYDVLRIQKLSLPQNHPDTLNTQHQIGNVLFLQGKFNGAFKAFTECKDQTIALFGPTHPVVLNILQKLEMININIKFKIQGGSASELSQHLQKDINTAASHGDRKAVELLLKDGADANDTDIDGRTPLHYAAGNGHVEIVKILLANRANIQLVTNKGNTALHTATSKGYKEIVEILCQHLSRDKISDFVNAKTTSTGTTALHVAAKAGSIEILKSLLKFGAIYNITNKEGTIPVNISKDQKVSDLLNLVEQLFIDVKMGNVECISKLKKVKLDEFLSITNARNTQGSTLLQVATASGHKNLASALLEMLKK